MSILQNPLLARINKMPGEGIRLPSLGFYYQNGELSEGVNNGEITLYPMTMTDDIMMKSPDMLFQGTAIERVFKRCSPDIQKPMDLLTADVDFILTHLRRISYGPSIELEYTCSNEKCNHLQSAVIPLEYFTSESVDIDPELFDKKYTVTTKRDGAVVKLKPVTFRDFIIMNQVSNDYLDDPDNLQDYALNSYASLIKSVNDVVNDSPENRDFIKQWLDTIPRTDAERITVTVNGIQDWGPKFEYKVNCSKCGETNDLSTSINPTSFFMLPSNLEISI